MHDHPHIGDSLIGSGLGKLHVQAKVGHVASHDQGI